MNRGLGSFIEGKSTLSGWQSGPDAAALVDESTFDGDLYPKQQQHELAHSAAKSRSLPNTALINSHISPRENIKARPTRDSPQHIERPLENRDGMLDCENPAGVFAKAANIIRESTEVEGCLFVDATMEAYRSLSGALYIWSESAKYPKELELAAILRQVLDGLIYLEIEGLEHGSINCQNILLSTKGDVKIANQQCCEKTERNREPRDVRALGIITMELMQKYTQDNGAVGVENLDRWHSDSDAVAFLSETTSAASARELRKHALLRHGNQKDVLLGLVSLAEIFIARCSFFVFAFQRPSSIDRTGPMSWGGQPHLAAAGSTWGPMSGAGQQLPAAPPPHMRHV
ncbi:hypothetical protein V498_08189 [Pseudogymnoascus sp. VKM F-4517 (FW-2822)]|nr:hypothetical protein V498_08189 [Pseudogymnoascus sp. VKM F-4517 (FW-2822)]